MQAGTHTHPFRPQGAAHRVLRLLLVVPVAVELEVAAVGRLRGKGPRCGPLRPPGRGSRCRHAGLHSRGCRRRVRCAHQTVGQAEDARFRRYAGSLDACCQHRDHTRPRSWPHTTWARRGAPGAQTAAAGKQTLERFEPREESGSLSPALQDEQPGQGLKGFAGHGHTWEQGRRVAGLGQVGRDSEYT